MTPQQKNITVYYDGTCRFCSGIVSKLERSSQKERFEMVPIQKSLPRDITREEAEHDVHVVDKHGVMHRGADAVLLTLSQYPRWKWLATFGLLPFVRPLSAFVYRLAADHRNQWF